MSPSPSSVIFDLFWWRYSTLAFTPRLLLVHLLVASQSVTNFPACRLLFAFQPQVNDNVISRDHQGMQYFFFSFFQLSPHAHGMQRNRMSLEGQLHATMDILLPYLSHGNHRRQYASTCLNRACSLANATYSKTSATTMRGTHFLDQSRAFCKLF